MDDAGLAKFLLDETDSVKRRVAIGAPPVCAGTLLPKAVALHVYRQKLEQLRRAQVVQPLTARFQVSTTMLAPLTHGVAPELGPHLRPVTLASVARRMNVIHEGCVLFGRVPLPPMRSAICAEVLLVEDENAIMLNLYNYVSMDEDPALAIPPGSFIAVLEPYMRCPRDDPSLGPPMLRCDNPQAIVLFGSEARWRAAQAGRWHDVHEARPAADADAWIARANRVLNDGRTFEAVRLYTSALAAAPDNVRALANRAAARLQLDDPSGALADAEAALRLEPDHLKCQFRRADALLQLCRLDEARAAADALPHAAASDAIRSSVRELREHVGRAQAERERGAYDNSAMEREAEASAARCKGKAVCSRRHADYESPSIVLQEAGGGKGRGMFARAEIVGGSLVMAAKAFEFVTRDKDGGAGAAVQMSCDRAGRADLGDSSALLARVIRKLVLQPERGRELYALSAGGGPLPPDSPIALRVDVPRIRGIVLENAFGASPLGANFRLQLRMAASREWVTQIQAEPDELSQGTGLWLKPALFNQSCLPNCDWHTAGDFLFVRANRSIAAGEELCIAYADVYGSDFARRAAIFESWGGGAGFACQCPRCELCRAQPAAASLESEVLDAFARATSLAGLSGRAAMSLTAAAARAMPPGRRRAVRAQLEALPLEGRLPLCKLRELDTMALRDAGRFEESLSEFECIGSLARELCGAQSIRPEMLTYQLRLVVGALALRHATLGDRDDRRKQAAVARAREVATKALKTTVATFCAGPWAPLTLAQLRVLAARQCAALGQLAPIHAFDELLATVVAEAGVATR